MTVAQLEERPLPVGSIGTLSNGYWGMVGLIATEAALFVFLLFAYYYDAVQPHEAPWPPDGPPSLMLALPATLLLLASSPVMWWGEQGAKSGVYVQQVAGLGLTVLMGLGFVVLQAFEWETKGFTITSGAYGSLFYVITGFHLAHVITGLLILLPVTLWSALGYFGPGRSAPVAIAAIYWHFVNAVLVAVFFTFYITPRLGLLWHAAQP